MILEYGPHDYLHIDTIICPHCDLEHDADKMYGCYEKEDIVVDCQGCQNKFWISAENSLKFTMGKIKPTKIEIEKYEALKSAADKLAEALEYYVKHCDACNWSGVDEVEFSARGCPSCDCLQARIALKEYRGKNDTD